MSIFALQLIQLCATILLLLSFSMLMQKRMLNLIRLLAMQGLILAIDIAFVAYTSGESELYFTAAITFILKFILIPFCLYKLLLHLKIYMNTEPLINFPMILLIGLSLVIFGFNLGVSIMQPFPALSSHALSLALASVLISIFMMVVKRNVVSQVIGLLSLENNLFFVGSSFASSMPIIVELGIAFDSLIGLLVFGIFFLKIRDNFESFDLHHLEKLQEK